MWSLEFSERATLAVFLGTGTASPSTLGNREGQHIRPIKTRKIYKKKDSDWLETFGKRQVENYKLQPYHFQADLIW
jgi:hypothetical protein